LTNFSNVLTKLSPEITKQSVEKANTRQDIAIDWEQLVYCS